MAYFIYDTEANALISARKRWEQVIGHVKNPQDVTEFAWIRFIGLDLRTAVDASKYPTAVPNTQGYLGPSATLDPANWPPLPSLP